MRPREDSPMPETLKTLTQSMGLICVQIRSEHLLMFLILTPVPASGTDHRGCRKELVYALEVELAVSGESCLELGAVCPFQGLELSVHARKCHPPHSLAFPAGFCGYELCQPLSPVPALPQNTMFSFFSPFMNARDIISLRRVASSFLSGLS